jgi:hypothetical protein
MASGTLSAMNTGAHIIVGGLFIQLIFFGGFLAVTLIFDTKMRRHPTARYADPQITPTARKHLTALYIASVFISVRSIFRVVEYVQGNNGYLLHHEYYLYIFDAVQMIGVMLVFNVVHPSEVRALLQGGNVSRGFRVAGVEKVVDEIVEPGEPEVFEASEATQGPEGV